MKKEATAATANDAIYCTGGISLPRDVRHVLELGPNFAIPPKITALELVAMAHHASRHAANSEMQRCASEGMGAVKRFERSNCSLPVSRTISYLKENSLCVLLADKEGGFAVLPKADFASRASEAKHSVFNRASKKSVHLCEEKNKRDMPKAITKWCLKSYK